MVSKRVVYRCNHYREITFLLKIQKVKILSYITNIAYWNKLCIFNCRDFPMKNIYCVYKCNKCDKCMIVGSPTTETPTNHENRGLPPPCMTAVRRSLKTLVAMHATPFKILNRPSLHSNSSLLQSCREDE